MHLISAVWALAGLTYYLRSTFDMHLQLGGHVADLFFQLTSGFIGKS